MGPAYLIPSVVQFIAHRGSPGNKNAMVTGKSLAERKNYKGQYDQ
jgi:hypothetical protein